VTAKPCSDHRYRDKGYYFVAVGETKDHFTFIVDPRTGAIIESSARGSDKETLQVMASVLLSQLK
jgi:hypothetical protein